MKTKRRSHTLLQLSSSCLSDLIFFQSETVTIFFPCIYVLYLVYLQLRLIIFAIITWPFWWKVLSSWVTPRIISLRLSWSWYIVKNHFSVIEKKNLDNMVNVQFYNFVSESLKNINFTKKNIDVSIESIIWIMQKALDKYCPIIEIDCSCDISKQKPLITDEIISLITIKKL